MTTWPSIRTFPEVIGLEAGDHSQRRGLAAARRADEDDELAGGDFEVELANGSGAVGIDLRQVLEGDLRHVCLLGEESTSIARVR